MLNFSLRNPTTHDGIYTVWFDEAPDSAPAGRDLARTAYREVRVQAGGSFTDVKIAKQ